MQKKIPYLIIFTFLLFAQHIRADSIQIETDQLLVRSGPGTEYEVIGHVDQGEQYERADEDGDWIAIAFNNETGWVHSQYTSIIGNESNSHEGTDPENAQGELEDESEGEGEGDQPNTGNTYPFNQIVKVDVVNIREEPTVQSAIIGELRKRQTVSIIASIDENWVEIETDDLTGFMPASIVGLNAVDNNSSMRSLSNKRIVIDPGHGGVDVGAISQSEHYESEYTLYTAQILANQLERLGASVQLTRDDDFYYALTPRSVFANYYDADVFLSLHYNSEPQYPTANGINTFYRDDRDQALADIVHAAILEETGANDRGVASGNYLVLRHARRPGLLLELGFLSNAEEELQIQSFAYQNEISRGIISGLQQYFSNQTRLEN
ncbi:N-acetylmuramoyl-L-alanine amidase [Amphibacillus marinus]|uniref:N-acetylmuramoyl-L-alanine amidase n=1 Tax=Amphibacillus marinus TaxID=872970 RepID=A0A1H8NY15_9BACI|nr:N-acetylmuramoyl-L-alanine amidase [Amphibacillus marinus]SEO34536.1 N-acetylmuramoyl-L-alanine amidase [Amphibacillus marinus]